MFATSSRSWRRADRPLTIIAAYEMHRKTNRTGDASQDTLLVPLTWSDRPATAARLSRTQQFVIERTLKSDFVFWAATRLFRGTMAITAAPTP